MQILLKESNFLEFVVKQYKVHINLKNL